jgi:hypothetical protein
VKKQPRCGCRGPSEAFIEKESQAWFAAIQRVFISMTDVPSAEIEADIPSGVPDNMVRTVTENSRTLKFTGQGLEKE